jgi:hypothetical protein
VGQCPRLPHPLLGDDHACSFQLASFSHIVPPIRSRSRLVSALETRLYKTCSIV